MQFRWFGQTRIVFSMGIGKRCHLPPFCRMRCTKPSGQCASISLCAFIQGSLSLFGFLYSFAEQLNRTFIDFLLDHIESSDHEQIPDLFLNLVLAYNLHFQMPSDNDVMKALADRGTAKTFTEKIMLLVNRGGEGQRTQRDLNTWKPSVVIYCFVMERSAPVWPFCARG